MPCMTALQMFRDLLCLTRCCHAGALLYDARELFDQQNAKADEGLRSIVHSLPEAVATCVDAAQAELEEPRQIALMKVRPAPTADKSLSMRYLRVSSRSLQTWPTPLFEAPPKPVMLCEEPIVNALEKCLHPTTGVCSS